ESHAAVVYDRAHKSHRVRIAEASQLASLYGTNAHVNSFHHQAVNQPGNGVTPVAWAEDGVVEAYEVEGRPVIGVQWHPECFGDDPLFGWLVSEAQSA